MIFNYDIKLIIFLYYNSNNGTFLQYYNTI